MMTTSTPKWLFIATSDFFSCQEKVFEEKRLNHLAKFVKQAHDRNFLKQNPKPSYIRDRVHYYRWRLKKEDAKLSVTIIPYSYATNQ